MVGVGGVEAASSAAIMSLCVVRSSVNIDETFQVPHIVRPGETIRVGDGRGAVADPGLAWALRAHDAAAAGPIPAVANEQGGIELTSATGLAEGAGEREVDPSRIEVPKQSASSQPETLPDTEARADGEPTRIVLYADFNCVHCADFESTNGDQIEQWLEQGEVTVEYRMVDYLSAPNNQNYSARAANAAYCVADQKPEAYNGFVAALFAAYDEHQGKGLDNAAITQLAQEHGADIASCVEDGTFRSAVEHTTRQARVAGVAGTPTVFVDGKNWALDGEDKTFTDWAGAKIAG